MKSLLKITAPVLFLICLSCARSEGEITVFSREEGSGTRAAFVELFDVRAVNEAGKKVDATFDEAEITNSTAVVINNVSQNKNAIGYISLGVLNNDVKALAINGAEANANNVSNGTYQIARPFLVVIPDNTQALVQDFISFILSSNAKNIIEGGGYIAAGGAAAEYSTQQINGKCVIAGSSSVAPLMEKLIEAYQKLNSAAVLELQQSDSSMGISTVISGIADIGMASRELTDSESSNAVRGIVIAQDGIAVIVNKDNQRTSVSKEDVRAIYLGDKRSWNEIKN